jgi:hypothetical protein
MSLWKCGKCGMEYETSELLKLKRVPFNPNPAMGGGYTVQCGCGYVFYKDRWRLKDTLTISLPTGEIEVTVSTIFTEYAWESRDGELLWFETVILPAQTYVECVQCWRYRTKEEAEKGHQRVVEALKAGRFKANPLKLELVVD